MKLKNTLLKGAIAFALMSQTGMAQEQWKLVITDLGSTFMANSGQQVYVPAPSTLVYQPGIGYVAQSPLVSTFIVRVGPASIQRGCFPATSATSTQFTGVTSTQAGVAKTVHVLTEQSPGKPGWTNFHFRVNNGMPVDVLRFVVVFQPTLPTTQCYFEVLYQSAPVVQPLLRSSSTPPTASPAGAHDDACTTDDTGADECEFEAPGEPIDTGSDNELGQN